MDLKKDSINCLKCHHRHPQNGNCTVVGGFCTSVPAAYCPLITELLARAEVAEARAEKAERERDAAVKTIFEYTGCPECKHWNGEDEWCEKHDREAGAEDGCSTPEWRGQKEE